MSLPLLLCCGLRCWRRLAVLACCAACGRSALGSVEGPQCCTRVGGPTGCSRLCTVSWTSVLFKQRLRSIKSPCRVQRVPHVKGKGLFTAALSGRFPRGESIPETGLPVKTPGGAGTQTWHTRDTRAHKGTRITPTNLTTIQTHQHTVYSGKKTPGGAGTHSHRPYHVVLYTQTRSPSIAIAALVLGGPESVRVVCFTPPFTAAAKCGAWSRPPPLHQ